MVWCDALLFVVMWVGWMEGGGRGASGTRRVGT